MELFHVILQRRRQELDMETQQISAWKAMQHSIQNIQSTSQQNNPVPRENS